jgi:hypothetical protein
MWYNVLVFHDEGKNLDVDISTHAQGRWDERCSHVNDIVREFKQAKENKRVLNDTKLVMAICEKYGVDVFPVFYTTDQTVFVCKHDSIGMVKCLTIYPVSKRMFKAPVSVVRPKKVMQFVTIPPRGSGLNKQFGEPNPQEEA